MKIKTGKKMVVNNYIAVNGIFALYTKLLLSLACLFILPATLLAQTPNQYQPYSFPFLKRLDPVIYDPGSRYHSSIKPVFTDDPIIAVAMDSLLTRGIDTTKRGWLYRKIFNEHLLQVDKSDFSFYADYLPDIQVGYETMEGKATWLNTRGVQFGASVGSKFSFHSSFYENQGVFPQYLNDFINRESIIPGQVYESNLMNGVVKRTKDWAYSSAVLSYTPVKYVNLQLGQDKNFIGDGYRSMLLSDLAANYPFFKFTFNLGNVTLQSMIAQMQDVRAPRLSVENGFRKKWAAIHYADWNINNRLSIGFYEAVIWQDQDETGKRGFDLSYANPFIFLRPVERQNGSPDNALLGLNLKYELSSTITFYGQFLLDELKVGKLLSDGGYWTNKWGLQAGIRGEGAFGVKHLGYLAELNTARPYTYSERDPIINYAHYNQPLAHPLGGNFREFLSIWNYSFKRFAVQAQVNTAVYGLDEFGKNYGKDVYRSYDDERVSDQGNKISQGVRTTLLYLDGRVSYLLNPKTNLRVELGAVTRNEHNVLQKTRDTWLTIGVRSSFRNLYQDF